MSKGTILDLIMIVVVVFGLAIGVMVGHTILTGVSDQISDKPEMELNQTYINRGIAAVETFNYSFIFLVIGLIISTIIGAYMINTHPAVFPISLVLLVIVGIISIPFSNVFYEFSRKEALVNATNSMPLMVTVMDYLPEIIIVLGILLAIALYMKYSGGTNERY